MNAAFLLMSSAALAGADASPPPAAYSPAPVVISGSGGCTNCGSAAQSYSYAPASYGSAGDCGCDSKKPGLFSRLKGKFGGMGRKSSSDCGCAPACAPVYVPPPSTCNTCSSSAMAAPASRPGLFDRLKSRCGHSKATYCGPVCDPCGGAHLSGGYAAGTAYTPGTPYTPGCATPGMPYTPPATGTTMPPKEMPKDPKVMPKDPKEMPKDKPKDKPKSDVLIPVPPVTGAGGLTGSSSPY